MSEFLPFLLIMQVISAVFVYFESKRLNIPNRMLWVIGVALFMPFFFPFYMLIRPKRVIFVCQNCLEENVYPTERCRNCNDEITPDKVVPIRTQWGLMDAFMILILSFFLLPMGLAGVANRLGIVDKELSSWGSIFVFNFIGTSSLLIISLWFLIKICKRSLIDIGLSRDNKFYRNILIGVVLVIPALFISYAVEEATIKLLVLVAPSQSEKIYEMQAKEHSLPGEIWPDDTREIGKFLSAGLLMIILAPIAEEIMFRGIIYNALRIKRGLLTSLIVSGLIFAFVHGQFIHFGEIFIVGVLIAYVYERTKSLIAPITLHIALNLAFLIAWYYFPSLYT